MNVRSFLDTNILLYTDDADAPAKHRRALDLLNDARSSGKGVVSMQVLQEYFNSATRKLRVDAETAQGKVELFAKLDVVLPQVEDLLAAIDLHRLHRFSIWDALIIQAAKQGACAVLYSEDMQHDRVVDGIRVLNPFR